jgi:signal recognition particle subunit SRP54
MFSVVIVDTAGRLGIDEELMKQAKDIRDAVNPDEVLFVIDSMVGQDAVNVAKAFDEGVGITGSVLTKLDGDARGGAALSVASVTGKPIIFASNGEGMDAFEPFYPDRMASRILDMGDILTLIEQTQRQFDETEAREMADKLAKDTFTLEDFLDQMQQLRKMGSLKSMLAMMPGAGQMRQQLENFDEKEIDRTEAIIRSMTPAERRQPKLLNGSRRLRIAKGSGMTVTDVNSLVNRFDQAAKMMKTVAKGGVPQIPGMPNMPGMGGFGGARGKSKDKGKKGSKSGNPAKRAAEEAARLAGGKPESNGDSAAGSAFGLGQ